MRAAKRAVELDPQNSYIHRVLGLIQFDDGDYKASAATLTKAKELGDSSEEVTEFLASALLNIGDLKKAEAVLNALVAMNPRCESAYFFLGRCAAAMDERDRALMFYRRASHLAPDEPEIFANIMALFNNEESRPQAMNEIEGRLSGPLRYLALWYQAKLEIQENNWGGSFSSAGPIARSRESR